MVSVEERQLIYWYALDPAGQADWEILSEDFKQPYRVYVTLIRKQEQIRKARNDSRTQNKRN